MKRKHLGVLLVVGGLALIVLACVTAYQNNCPASTYNGTGPPPAGQPCPSHEVWTALLLTLLVVGILLIPAGGAVALYHRA